MTYEEAKNRLNACIKYGFLCRGCEFEHDCSIEKVHEMASESLEKQSELAKGIEDLKDTLNDAYALNDFVLNKVLTGKTLTEAEDIAEMFSVKAMQNLSWLLAVIDGSDSE